MYLNFLSRILLSILLIGSIAGNISQFPKSVNMVKNINFPLPTLSVILGLVIKVLGIYSILTLRYIKYILPILISFIILVTILFNNPVNYPNKINLFFTLIGYIGGLIYFYLKNK